jgi:hypothetical protein
VVGECGDWVGGGSYVRLWVGVWVLRHVYLLCVGELCCLYGCEGLLVAAKVSI